MFSSNCSFHKLFLNGTNSTCMNVKVEVYWLLKVTFNIFDPVRLKLLTRLRVGLSHLIEHKFKHKFSSCVNALCSCSSKVESTIHFFCTAFIFLTFLKPYLMNWIQYVTILLIFQIPVRLTYFLEFPKLLITIHWLYFKL